MVKRMRPFAELGRRGQVGRLKQLARAALAQYDLDITRMTPMVHAENTTFRLDGADGARYVLRITRPGKNTVEGVRSEMMWLTALRRDTALGVPAPVPTRTGELLTVAAADGVPEPRTCVVFRWVMGRFLNEGLTPRHLAQVGAFIARLHDHAAGFTPPAGFRRGYPDRVDDAVIADNTGRVAEVCPPEDVELVRVTLGRIRHTIDSLGEGPDAYGLIHADLHQWNYLFHKGEVQAIDFDDCGYGHFLYDLAVTLSEIPDRPDIAALREALLAGYRTVRPLNPAHEPALAAVLVLRHIHLMLWVIEMRDHPDFRDDWQRDAAHLLNKVRAFMSDER
jgi:Ser/Thr protein kinase RdoA (MazF antagonist)